MRVSGGRDGGAECERGAVYEYALVTWGTGMVLAGTGGAGVGTDVEWTEVSPDRERAERARGYWEPSVSNWALGARARALRPMVEEQCKKETLLDNPRTMKRIPWSSGARGLEG